MKLDFIVQRTVSLFNVHFASQSGHIIDWQHCHCFTAAYYWFGCILCFGLGLYFMPIWWIFRICVLDIRDARNCARFFLYIHFLSKRTLFSFSVYMLLFERRIAISPSFLFLSISFTLIFFLWPKTKVAICARLWINIWIKAHFHFALYLVFLVLNFCTHSLAHSQGIINIWICAALNRVELIVVQFYFSFISFFLFVCFILGRE